MIYNISKKGGKQGIQAEVIAWVIALLVLAFAVIMILILNKQGINILDKIKEFLRFGR